MVYFGTLICPLSTKSLLRLHGFLLTRLFLQSLKKQHKQRTPGPVVQQCHEPQKQHLWQTTHSKGLTKLATLPDYRHPGMLCIALQPCQKLCMILVDKVVLKLKLCT